MKLRPVLFAATSLLLPLAGLATLQLVSPIRAALAEPPFVSASSLAQNTSDQTPQGNRHRGDKGDKWLQQLNLTSEQQAQIKSIQGQVKASSQDLRQQMRTARDQMNSLLASNNASDDQIRQQHQQLENLHRQLSELQFETMLQIRKVLTPEQRSKLSELRENRQHRTPGEKKIETPPAS